jgi:MFS family permease
MVHNTSVLYSSNFIRLALANFFTVSSFGSFFMLPLFVSRRGGSKADIGVVMGVFALASVLSRPWIADMVDRMGRKRSYTVGCCIMGALPLTYLLFQGPLSRFFLPLLLVRLIHGVGLALCFTAVFTYVVDIIPEGRLNEGLGMFGITGLLGLAAGPALSEVIVRYHGFQAFFLTASALGIAGLTIQFSLPESFRIATSPNAEGFFRVLFQSKMMSVALLAFLFGFGLAASGSFVTPFAKENQLRFVSLYFIAYSTAAVGTRLLGGRVADRVGEGRIIPPALVLTGSGLILLTMPLSSFLLMGAGLLSGCGHGFLFPCLNSLAVRDEPHRIRGKIIGAFTGSIDAGAFVGAVTLGYIGEWAGFRALFLTAGTALLLGFGFYHHRSRHLSSG